MKGDPSPPAWIVPSLGRLRRALQLDDVAADWQRDNRRLYLRARPARLLALVKDPRSTRQRLRDMGLRDEVASVHGDTPWAWDELEYAVARALHGHAGPAARAAGVDLGDILDTGSGLSVLPVPLPGGPQYRYYSVATGSVKQPVAVPPVDYCRARPVLLGEASGPALVTYHDVPGRPSLEVTLSHGLEVEDLARLAPARASCWPSLAASWRLPPSYGPVIFLADARILGDLFSTRRYARVAYLAGTDTWSPTGREIDRLGKAATLELRADPAWWVNQVEPVDGGMGIRGIQSDLVSALPPAELLVGGAMSPELAADPVKSHAALARRLAFLRDRHATDGDLGLHARGEAPWSGPGDSYPYCELKVAAPVPFSCWVACLYPATRHRLVARLLQASGFRGVALPVKATWPGKDDHGETADARRAAYTAMATIEARRWARATGRYLQGFRPRGARSYSIRGSWS